MAKLGYHVYSIDLNFDKLKEIDKYSAQIIRLCVDLTQGVPIKLEVFNIIIIVDYVQKGFLTTITKLLKPGGYLIYKTFAAHGQNWVSLPQKGETISELGSNYDYITFTERTAGPKEYDKVSIRLFAQKQ